MTLTHATARTSEAAPPLSLKPKSGSSSDSLDFAPEPFVRSSSSDLSSLKFEPAAVPVADRRASIRAALMIVSFACIIVPLPLIGVMGYLVADSQTVGAYYTAITALAFCGCAIAAYFARRFI